MPSNPASTAASTPLRTSAHDASNASSRMSTCMADMMTRPARSALGERVPGLHVADLLDAELRRVGSLAPSVAGGEQEPDVVAGVDALDDRPREPVAPVEHRTPVRARGPLDLLELVDVVAGLGAEDAGQVLVALSEHVHDERSDAERGPVGPVRLRQPDAEARRLDAALCREGDQAPVALVTRCGSHHVGRRVLLADDGLERVLVVGHEGRSTPRSVRPIRTATSAPQQVTGPHGLTLNASLAESCESARPTFRRGR